MTHLPSRALQPMAAQIARAICASDGAQVQALCNSLATLMPPPTGLPSAKAGVRQPSNSNRIGIWAREESDQNPGYRRLDRYRSEWRLWADVEEIPAKSKGPRIAFLGESVARGYFYDPVFAPAAVLQKLLRCVPELHDAEVVDLARSNIDPAGILELAGQTMRLKADVMVVFAGNNFCFAPFFPSSVCRDLGKRLADRGYRGFIDHIETWRFQRTDALLDRLATIAGNTGTRVIVVVPEFNLLDWREDRTWLVPILEADRNMKWFDLARQAQAALDAGQVLAAKRLAAGLIELDEATSPVGLSILARCHLHEGDFAKARELLETARDVVRALPVFTSPGCPRAVQRALRNSREKHGFHVVDLPQLIQQRLDGQLPDRRVFLDYCHLTSTGIGIVTEAVAKTCMQMLGAGRPFPLRDASAVLSTPPEVEADAHFMAAIHCARWQQSEELVRFHCAEAARHSPATAEKMAAYLDTFSRAGAPWLGRRFPSLIGPSGSPTYRYFCEVSPFAHKDLQDEPLVDVMRKTVRERSPTVGAAGRRPSNSVRAIDKAINLISKNYFAPSALNSKIYSLQTKVYFEAYEPVSRFLVWLDESMKFRLEMTYRTPAAEPDHLLTIHVNGTEKRRFPACRDWTSAEVHDIVFNAGGNELAVMWPRAQGATKARIQHSLVQLHLGILPNPLMEFGHCHRLRLVKALIGASPPAAAADGS